MNPQVTQTLSQILALTGQIATVGAAFVPLLVPLAPLIINSVASRIKDRNRRRAFEVVGQAGSVATSVAAAEVARMMEEARKPGSKGGTTITPEERNDALAAGAAAGWRWAQDQLPAKLLTGVYGDKRTVEDCLKAKARQNLEGNAAGLKEEPASVVLSAAGVQ